MPRNTSPRPAATRPKRASRHRAQNGHAGDVIRFCRTVATITNGSTPNGMSANVQIGGRDRKTTGAVRSAFSPWRAHTGSVAPGLDAIDAGMSTLTSPSWGS